MATEGLEKVADSEELMELDRTRLPEEFRAKAVETVRALRATQSFFEGIEFMIFLGTVTGEGAWKGLKMIETIVNMSWGQGMPERFTVRSFLDSDNDDETVIGGIIEALKRVVDFCVGRAEEPHTDYLRRFLATMTEIRTILDNSCRGNHLELVFQPGVRAAHVSLNAYIDGHELDDLQPLEEEQIRELRDQLVDFLKEVITDTLEAEEQMRRGSEDLEREMAETPEEPVEASA